MPIEPKQWLLWISEMQALCRTGLTYTKSEFERERFLRLMDIAAEMASEITITPPEPIKNMFTLELESYATPVLDIRSFVLQDDKILLVRERSDSLWSLPGGFADVNESPSEAVVRETLEESGFLVKPLRLLVLWDKLKQGAPLSWPHIYKCIFHCELLSGERQPNMEISEIDFFPLQNLPPLSKPRINSVQIQQLYDLVKNPQNTMFD